MSWENCVPGRPPANRARARQLIKPSYGKEKAEARIFWCCNTAGLPSIEVRRCTLADSASVRSRRQRRTVYLICGEFSSGTTLQRFAHILTALPQSLGDLTQLKELLANNNDLRSIPMSVGGLRSLSELALGRNALTELPDSISSLQQLKRLWLNSGNAGNPIGTVPNCIRKLQQLEKLGIRGCGLASRMPRFSS